jgi:hypothetical protein
MTDLNKIKDNVIYKLIVDEVLKASYNWEEM